MADRIDPEFTALDAGAAGRAQECRQQIEQVLDVNTRGFWHIGDLVTQG